MLLHGCGAWSAKLPKSAQKQYTLDKLLGQLSRSAPADSAMSWDMCRSSRGGVELLFRVFGDRYERASVLVTSNLAVQ